MNKTLTESLGLVGGVRFFRRRRQKGEEAGPKGGGTCAGSVQKWMKSYRLIVADRPHLVSVFEY